MFLLGIITVLLFHFVLCEWTIQKVKACNNKPKKLFFYISLGKLREKWVKFCFYICTITPCPEIPRRISPPRWFIYLISGGDHPRLQNTIFRCFGVWPYQISGWLIMTVLNYYNDFEYLQDKHWIKWSNTFIHCLYREVDDGPQL